MNFLRIPEPIPRDGPNPRGFRRRHPHQGSDRRQAERNLQRQELPRVQGYGGQGQGHKIGGMQRGGDVQTLAVSELFRQMEERGWRGLVLLLSS